MKFPLSVLVNFPGRSVINPVELIPAHDHGCGLDFNISVPGPGSCHYSCYTVHLGRCRWDIISHFSLNRCFLGIGKLPRLVLLLIFILF